MEKYDFSGWATRNNLKCSDGRTIMKDAFKHNDGQVVPLVWNHQHNDPLNVLGHALLENREDGVYAYGKFNETESGQAAKLVVKNGDVKALSIYANQLKQNKGDVYHGQIREVSLVLAGANPGAYIDSIISHGEESDEEAVMMFVGEDIELSHSDVEVSDEEEIVHADENKEEKGETMTEETKKPEGVETEETEETVQEVWDTLSEKQKTVVYAVIGQAIADAKNEKSEGEETEMKQNAFDNQTNENVLSHADQQEIVALAKASNVGSLQTAISIYAENNNLQHGFEQASMEEYLFPEFKNLNPGAPELLRQDQSWVMQVINKIHKSPYSRIRTRQADARIAELRAKGYQKKGDQKTLSANIKMIGRTTDPQTVYRKDELHRDDIIDITDFDVVNYQWGVMKDNMYEELALAALVGDGREDGDPDKIHQEHIRSIWNDEELYTIHKDVDIEAARAELQGTNTGANFGENYIYAEAIITAALYAREQYKGSGKPDLFCAPHLVNVMLLARDLNGRRIYDSKTDLAKALNVNQIFEIEQLEGKTRTTDAGEKKLLGLFVNLADYTFGSTKGGELTKFDDFDIDFNKYKYLMETRLSGALTKVQAAIALEEPVKA